MSRSRTFGLVGLAGLAIIFLTAAAYVFLDGRPDRAGAGDVAPLRLEEAPLALRLTLNESGIARVPYGDLQAAKLPFEAFSPQGLTLTNLGEPVPFVVLGEGEERALYFMAQAITDTLDAPAVYWLSAGTGREMARETVGRPPAATTVDTATRHHTWEKDETFLAQAAGSDVWLGELLFAPTSHTLSLDGIQPSGGPGYLKVRIWSNNETPVVEPDHHVTITLNGVKLGDHYWDGIRQETISALVPAGILRARDNVLVIAAPGDTGAAGEALYLDWVSLEYEGQLELGREPLWFSPPRTQDTPAVFGVRGASKRTLLFDVTEPDAPHLLEGSFDGGTLTVASGGDGARRFIAVEPDATIRPELSAVSAREPLRASGRGADYVAIYAEVEGFESAIEPLLNHRASQGLQTEALPVSQIYDEFAYGRSRTEAIRDFLAYAAAEWQPTPRFVLLVGDASYDIRDVSGAAYKNLLPTHLVFTEYAGYVASDTWFTMLAEGSPEPALAIGRFPAQSAAQLAAMVAKTIAYENVEGAGWLTRALLVADDEPQFDRVSDNLADELAENGFETQKLYMTADEGIREPLLSALNLGTGIVNYVGHGSIEVWADERIFEADDARRLSNRDRLPIFTTFTCLNGYFNHPDVDALAETLLSAEGGGVVAAVAPSGRSLTSQQLPLANAFFELLLSGEVETLGEVLLQAKMGSAGDDDLRDVIHTFNLLGDPALRFRRPLIQ